MVIRYTSGGPRRQLLLRFCIISEEQDREQVCKENKTSQSKTWTERPAVTRDKVELKRVVQQQQQSDEAKVI